MILEQEESGDWWWDVEKGTGRAACIATQHFLWVQPEGLMLLGVRLADWCEFHPPPHCHHAPSGLPSGQGNPSSQNIQNGPLQNSEGHETVTLKLQTLLRGCAVGGLHGPFKEWVMSFGVDSEIEPISMEEILAGQGEKEKPWQPR